jgi:hypothetical protein
VKEAFVPEAKTKQSELDVMIAHLSEEKRNRIKPRIMAYLEQFP